MSHFLRCHLDNNHHGQDLVELLVRTAGWFAGVKSTRALLDNGLHFIGDVKTNSS